MISFLETLIFPREKWRFREWHPWCAQGNLFPVLNSALLKNISPILNLKAQVPNSDLWVPCCKSQVARSKLHVPDFDVPVSIVDLRMVNPTRNVPSFALQVDVDFTRGQWYAIDDFHVPFRWLPRWLTVHNNHTLGCCVNFSPRETSYAGQRWWSVCSL